MNAKHFKNVIAVGYGRMHYNVSGNPRVSNRFRYKIILYTCVTKEILPGLIRSEPEINDRLVSFQNEIIEHNGSCDIYPMIELATDENELGRDREVAIEKSMKRRMQRNAYRKNCSYTIV